LLSRREASALAGVPLASVDKAIEQRVIRSVSGKRGGIPVEEVGALALLHRAGIPLPRTIKRKIRDWAVARPNQRGSAELALGETLVVRMGERLAGVAERADRYARDRDAFIERDPEIKGGEPVIRGTRLTASAVEARLAAGDSLDELASEYPHVPREALEAAALYGRTHPRRGRPRRPWAS
jgi:uncharacterized protein (DUF433 family)